MPEYNIRTPAASAWSEAFAFTNNDGTIEDISSRTWEFVVRPSVDDTSTPAPIAVTTVNSAQGVITVDIPTATVLVSLTATAVALMGTSTWAHALWMDKGLSSAVARLDGTFTAVPVAAP